jgi:hypothetical protein
MEHLEFVEKLDKLGISIRSTNAENKVKEIDIPRLFTTKKIVMRDFKLTWKEKEYGETEPIKAILAKAVDMDSWKHSWHTEMIPENYEKIEHIIQEKIINRAEEIDELMSIYFQLHYEMSNE